MRHYLVSGRVQGVGFRKFVYKRAVEFGLTGQVRNLADGRVEIVARGPLNSISMFEEEVSHGPMISKVTGVDTTTIPESRALYGDDFKILEDGEAPWSFA